MIHCETRLWKGKTFLHGGVRAVLRRAGILAIVLAATVALSACLGGGRPAQYDASNLYRAYMRDDAEVTELDGRVINVTGTVTRVDQSTARNLFVELDHRIIVFIRQDQVVRLGEMGIKVGDAVSAVGVFGGKSAVTKWTTASGNAVLVLENGEIAGRTTSWLPF